MHDDGQGSFTKRGEIPLICVWDFDTQGAIADTFSSLTDSLQRDAFLVYIAYVAEVLECILLAMKGSDYPQTCGAAVYGVVLGIEWKWCPIA